MRARQQGNIVQIILLALIAAGAMLVSCRRLLPWILHRAGADTPDMIMASYRLDILWPNYFENGFIRRGFGGTIKELIRRSSLIDPAAGYHAANTILLLIPLMLLLRGLAARGGRIWLWFATLLVLSPQLFLGWGADFGRSDMLGMSFVAWSALAIVHRRHALAVGALLAGSLVHETVLFYGAPLLAAFAWLDHREGRLPLRQGTKLAAFLLGGLIIIALAQRLLGDTPSGITRTILRHDPDNGYGSAYYTVGGLRTLLTSACMSFSTGDAALKIASCFAVLALYMAMLVPGSRRSLAVMVFASFLPMAAMSVVAIDYGRWLMMAVMNAWLASVMLRTRDQETAPAAARHVAAAAGLLLLLIPMKTPSYYANDAARALSESLLGPRKGPQQFFAQCDPEWRSTVTESQASPH